MNVKHFTDNHVLFNDWLKSLGRSPVTGWRWENDNRVKTVRFLGRRWISHAEIERFYRDGVSPENNPPNPGWFKRKDPETSFSE